MRLASVTAALMAAPVLAPQPASACSKGSLWAPLNDGVAYFSGTATADTLLAGPGSVAYGVGGGRYARAADGSIYGQVIAIDAIGGPAAEGLPRGVEEVVVIPWDYDASCRPLAWGRSARWVPPGTGGFYIAELRAPEHWVDRTPTFDLHNPGHLPYTGTEPIREMGPGATIDSMLTPTQLFDLYRALPAELEIETGGAAALSPLREWIDGNPDLVTRPPASWLIGSVVRAADRADLSRVDHPVHGTWRFDIRLPDGSTRIVYGRTDPRTMDRWSPSRDLPRPAPEQLRLAPPEGFSLLVTLEDALEALPDTVPPWNFARGHLYTLPVPDPAASGEIRWSGKFESSFLSAALGRHPVVQRVRQEGYEAYRARAAAGLPEEMPATFTLGSNGALRVRQSYPLAGGVEVVVEGERLSGETIVVVR